ncbi:MAG: CHAT domain-containing protein, partial [Microcystaceae cyanobacterium]
ISGEEITVNLNNLTITEGQVTDIGGGILNSNTLTINNSIISGNIASSSSSSSNGGGIYNNGILTVNNSTISGNTASSSSSSSNGGGIYNNGILTVNNSTISGNTASSSSSSSNGGGIYNISSGTLNLTDLTIGNNSATNGSGIFSETSLVFNGTTNIGSDIVTSGSQTYNDAVTLNNSATLTGTDLILNGINGNNNDLVLDFSSPINIDSSTLVDINNFTNQGSTTIFGNLTTTGSQTYIGIVTLTNNSILITTDSNITFSSQVNGNANLTISTGSGNITFNSEVGNSDALGSLTLNSSGITQFDNTINASDLTTNVAGETQINGDVTTSGTQTYNDLLTLEGERILTGNEINFSSTVSGGGETPTLTLKTFDNSRNIEIGASNNDNSNQLNLTTSEINNLENGFDSIIIGSEESQGEITISNDVIFQDPVILRSPSITVDSNITGQDDSSITLESNNIQLNGNLTTNNQDITIKGQTILGSDVTLNTDNSNGDISFEGKIDGNFALTLDAGSGEIEFTNADVTFSGVTYEGAIGNDEPLASLTVESPIVGASLLVRTIEEINTQNIVTDGGALYMSSQRGDLTTGDIITSGGDVTLLADNEHDITTGIIDTSGEIGGNVFLDPLNVTVTYINAEGSSGRGGNITIITENIFTSTGTFFSELAQRDVNLSSLGQTEGGEISFEGQQINLGELSINRLLFQANAQIRETVFSRAAASSYDLDFTEVICLTCNNNGDSGDNSNIGGGDIVNPEVEPPNPPETPEDPTSDTDDTPKRQDPQFFNNTYIAEITPKTLATSQEETFSESFENHLGLTEREIKRITVNQIQSKLAEIENLTDTRTGLIYVTFQADSVAQNAWIFGDNRTRIVPSNNEAIAANDQLVLIVVTPRGEVIQYPVEGVTRRQVMTIAEQFANKISGLEPEEEYIRLSQQLYQWLIAPLESELTDKNINNLTFIFDRGLRSLPIAALHDGENYLIQRYSLGLMPSFSLTDTTYNNLNKRPILAMGTGNFEEHPNLNNLPAVPVELQEITNIETQGDLFLNEEFTIENLQQAHQANAYKIVHLATHAKFNSGTAENSFIQFADQPMSLNDLEELKLNSPTVDLLVLSACETALGDREAELGFAGIAVKTGVRSVLGSLWEVSDAGTLSLMVNFYEQLQEVPVKAEALRNAQLAMLQGNVQVEGEELVIRRGGDPTRSIKLPSESVSQQDFSHPYFWSGFTLIGNPW